ncbi:uncharacterized protein LOC131686797 [Topomyia yanbarensis]|uniref:uncharacterized protein LOC131686797 n=1 Tax=Topomyia yanbarensis TaxID=2498891 RepID=UPI00273C48E6|nr:uncharacterized protein LOC131686797 [Topomyia yanbarensis]
MSYQQGKNRLYPRYSFNSSDNEDTPIHRSIYAQPYNSQLLQQQQSQQQLQQHQQQQQQQQCILPVVVGAQSANYYGGYRSVKNSVGIVGTGHGQSSVTSTTPPSDNGSSATLTDAEAILARENTLLVNNGEFGNFFKSFRVPFPSAEGENLNGFGTLVIPTRTRKGYKWMHTGGGSGIGGTAGIHIRRK